MRKTSREDRISAMMHEVEKAARKLRADIRKRARAVGLPRDLKSAAAQLRKRAAHAAAQVEKYVHEIRTGLERGASRPTRARAKRKR